jgi:hypothetical protein
MFKYLVATTKESCLSLFTFFAITNELRLFKKIFAVFSETLKKLGGKDEYFSCIKSGGNYSDHRALNRSCLLPYP